MSSSSRNRRESCLMAKIRPVWIGKPAVCGLVMLAVVFLFAAVGCGGSNGPEGAVQKYLKAMQDMNWEDYKASLKPDQEMTQEEEELAKQKFEQVNVKCENLKFSIDYDEEDNNKAVVVATDGKITYTAEILGEEKTETVEVKNMAEEERPSFDVVKVKGVWYVDKPLG